MLRPLRIDQRLQDDGRGDGRAQVRRWAVVEFELERDNVKLRLRKHQAGHWTAAAWAVEGAGVLWIALAIAPPRGRPNQSASPVACPPLLPC